MKTFTKYLINLPNLASLIAISALTMMSYGSAGARNLSPGISESSPSEIDSPKSSSAEDTLKKHTEKRLPLSQQVAHPKTRPRIPPVANLSITTEIPLTLFYDRDTAGVMHLNNKVEIVRTKPGEHILTFRTKSWELEKKIIVDSCSVRVFKLMKDSTLTDSVSHRKLLSLHPQKISNYYIPFKQSVSIQFKPGISFNNSSSVFNGKLIAAYYFNQRLSLGLGSGISGYCTKLKWVYFNLFDWTHPNKYETSYFEVSYIPVFLNFTFTFLKKRFTPFLSVDGGLSFPLTTSVTGMFIGDIPYGTITENARYFKVDNIKAGGYAGLELGCKYYISPKVDLGMSLGVELSFNSFTGRYFTDAAMQEYVSPLTYHNTTAAFSMHLVLGVNFSSFK